MASSCPPGQVRRKAYTRRSRSKSGKKKVRVKSKCIKDRGLPGKGPKLFKVEHPGILTGFGYHTSELGSERRRAIEKAVKSKGYAEIFRALNNLRIWNKNVNPGIAEKATSDIEYLRSHLCQYSLSGCPATRRRSRKRSKSRRRSKSRKRSRRRSRSPRRKRSRSRRRSRKR